MAVVLVVATDVVSGNGTVAGVTEEAVDELEPNSDFIGAATGVGVGVVAMVDLKRLPPENNEAAGTTAGVVTLLLLLLSPLLLSGRDGLAVANAGDF